MISWEWSFERHFFLVPFYHFLFLALQERLKFVLPHSSQTVPETTKPCDHVESPLESVGPNEISSQRLIVSDILSP